MRVALLKRVLVGRPMPLAQARHERLRKRVGRLIDADGLVKPGLEPWREW